MRCGRVPVLVAAVVVVGLGGWACGGGDAESGAPGSGGGRPPDWPSSITLGAIPAEEASSLEADFATTRAILMDELGLEAVEFFRAADYADIVDAIVAGRVDAAQLGGFSYVIATDRGADISLAGVIADGPGVEPGYRSYAVTRPGSGIASLDDLADRTVCFVDPGSTSGFLFPAEGLLAAGLDPSGASADVVAVFAGAHDASALAVAGGECDAGFVYDSMLTDQLVGSGDIAGVIDSAGNGAESVNPEVADLEIIWKSRTIPGTPMVIGNHLPRSFVAAFAEVLVTKVNAGWALANGYCEGTVADNDCSFTDEAGSWGFAARDDSFYDGIRNVCEATQAPECN